MISIVIPVFNEEINLQKLITEILKVIKEVKLNYEIIFVDDGSTDKSFEILSNLALEMSTSKYCHCHEILDSKLRIQLA